MYIHIPTKSGEIMLNPQDVENVNIVEKGEYFYVCLKIKGSEKLFAYDGKFENEDAAEFARYLVIKMLQKYQKDYNELEKKFER